MRFESALGLSVGMMLSCTAENAAFSDGDMLPGVESSTTSSTSGQTSSSASDATAPPTEGVSTSTSTASGSGSQTTDVAIDAGTDSRCWSTSISILAEDHVPQGALLTDVPLKVLTSRLDPESNLETLRFYQGDELLPHEFEGQGRFAWVRVREILAGQDTEIRAVIGASCRGIPARLPEGDVWSASYVAVFHFDDDSDPLTFVDSVSGIELLPDADTEVGRSKWVLGPYARKLGDGSIQASNPVLDLHGDAEISTLGWVQLEDAHADVLPWNDENARHRELIAKLPGYRLIAVRGQHAPLADVPMSPSFNLSQSIVENQHDNVAGPAPVPAGVWTMLTGTYDGDQMRLFVGADLVATHQPVYTPASNELGTIRVGRWLRGGVDELRISNEARTPAWIAIQHASMTNTLLEYGARVPKA